MPFPLIRPLRLATSSLVLLLCALAAHAQNTPSTATASTPAPRPAGSSPVDGTAQTPAAAAPTAADAALLSRLIPQISTNFGLGDAQIARLSPAKRDKVQNTVNMLGGVLIGKLITKDVILRGAKAIGVRLTAQQASKYVPIAGQAVAAALGYATLRYLGEQHLRDCVRVAHEAGISLPPVYPALLDAQ